MTRPDPRRLWSSGRPEGGWGRPIIIWARVKCAVTDRLMILAEVCEAAGVVPHIEVHGSSTRGRRWGDLWETPRSQS
jgi:hypothetical protein